MAFLLRGITGLTLFSWPQYRQVGRVGFIQTSGARSAISHLFSHINFATSVKLLTRLNPIWYLLSHRLHCTSPVISWMFLKYRESRLCTVARLLVAHSYGGVIVSLFPFFISGNVEFLFFFCFVLKNPMKDRYYKMHLLHSNIKWRDNQKNQKLMLCPCRRWCAVGLSAADSWCFAGDERETDGLVTNFVAKTLNLELDPNVWRVESSKDSRDVAQNLVSPSMGRNSQWRRVSAMAVACGEAAEKEKKFRR
nr:hypothetical protein CUMW_239710 [Ipomoea batatas]GME21816.1 hypothetical protein CUMW_239710 [Ipomoea batatas]